MAGYQPLVLDSQGLLIADFRVYVMLEQRPVDKVILLFARHEDLAITFPMGDAPLEDLLWVLGPPAWSIAEIIGCLIGGGALCSLLLYGASLFHPLGWFEITFGREIFGMTPESNPPKAWSMLALSCCFVGLLLLHGS
jgi:hypothetical protein